jgi:hypothetical protein
MSVPIVAHLEPQRGGCCTVMPYFVGDILELPLTTIQDYSLFHILGDYSTDIWKSQIEEILRHYGLMTFLTHPDYLVESRARGVYRDLLRHLRARVDARRLWHALPAELDRWWRQRQRMSLVADEHGSWRIEGPGCAEARIAYASVSGGRLVITLDGEQLS